MRLVAINKEKDQLSALIHAVEEGEEVVLTRHGKPTVRLVRDNQKTQQTNREIQTALALDRLKELRATIKPAVNGKTDWLTLRDNGRA